MKISHSNNFAFGKIHYLSGDNGEAIYLTTEPVLIDKTNYGFRDCVVVPRSAIKKLNEMITELRLRFDGLSVPEGKLFIGFSNGFSDSLKKHKTYRLLLELQGVCERSDKTHTLLLKVRYAKEDTTYFERFF